MSQMLIVEDNADIAGLYKTLFSEHHTVVLPDVPQAMRYLSTNKPDLVITDFHLAKGTGNDLINYIRRHESLADVPILGVSVDDMWESEALRQGASAFMSKPIDLGQLLSMSRSLLSTQGQAATDRPLRPEAVLAQYIAAYEAVYHRRPECYWTGRHYLIERQRCDQAWLRSETERLRSVVQQPTSPRSALLRLIDKLRKL